MPSIAHALLATLLVGSAPEAPAVCSVVEYDFARQENRSYFTAAPLPDTVLAGMGSNRLQAFAEEPGAVAGPRRTVYGQVARAERIGGRDTAAVEAAFRASGTREVVLVPWAYSNFCRPTPWRGSARWAELGIPGFYVATLRERKDWAGARPTYDVFFAGRYPYPSGAFFRGTAPGLNAAEYFDLYTALPAQNTPYAARREAARRLWTWVRAHPEVAMRAPTPRVLEAVRSGWGWSEADVERAMREPAPVPATATPPSITTPPVTTAAPR
ncbi:MAG TPA: hypothetical protein VE913_18110 [Longimicrobium sp.]|nr:hypothetical protein [Longimicrobium sp.]